MYVNGYVIAVPDENKDAYVKVAHAFLEIAKDYGVIEIVENWERDVPDGEQTDFRRAVNAKAGERIVFSWVIWPDKKTEEEGHKKMWDDPRMKDFGEMPFDGKRMILGGFEPIVRFHKDAG